MLGYGHRSITGRDRSMEKEDFRLIPLACIGLLIGVGEVFIKPAAQDLGHKVLQFLEDKNILTIEHGE